MPNDNVLPFPSPDDMTTPDQALIEARDRGLTSVFILGYTPENFLYIRGSGDMTHGDLLWMLETAKIKILLGDEE
jgi:hypothetical protein